MKGQRALEVLGGFATGQLAFTAEEIEELLKAGCVIETDPRDMTTLRWLDPIVRQYAEVTVDDSEAGGKLAAKYAELDEKLKSDWYRFTTGAAKLQERETERRNIRRALGIINDKVAFARLTKMVLEARQQLPPGGGMYYPCTALGDELYALSIKGVSVRDALALRADRYKDYPLSEFLKQFDKTAAKMQAFGSDIAKLSSNIGPVKKNPHQVVIGLVKTGAPADQALATYHNALRTAGTPDGAVTLARNAQAHGGEQQTRNRLRTAEQTLLHAGFPNTPTVLGAAKTLMPFEPLQAGATRFVQIATLVETATQVRGDATIKVTARLMPAEGTPQQVVDRVQQAYAELRRNPSNVHPVADELAIATALASMVKDIGAIGPLVIRFRAVEAELVNARVSAPETASGDALECVGTAGTPTEVAATVRQLIDQLARQENRSPQRGDVAIAVAFAKRFAY